MFSHRLACSAVLCVVLTCAVTACGGSKSGSPDQAAAPTSAAASASASPTVAGVDPYHMSAKQIFDASGKAMSGLSSMHVAGTVTSDGQKVTLDLSADKDKNCTGTVTDSGTGSMDILHNSAGTWVRPDAAAWQGIAAQQGTAKSGAAIAEIFKGRWLTGGDSDPDFQQTVGMCDLISGLSDNFSKGSNPILGGHSTVNGIPTVGLLISDDSGPSTLYIATQGQPYLLRVQNNGSDPGTMDLDGFNKPLNVQAPPADQVIDFSKFQQQAKSA